MKKFKKIYIEITNVCNHACSFCPKTTRKPEFMGTDTFCKILGQIRDYTGHIYFHVKGEPLLHPELEQMLDISHAHQFKVNITTNGTLIHRVKEMLLTKPALRQMNFSLHSFDGNEIVRDKEEYVSNILSFTKKAVHLTDMIIALRLWNLNESNALAREREKNSELLHRIEKEFQLPFKIQETSLPERGIQIAQRVYIHEDHQFQWPGLHQEEGGSRGFCYGLRSQAAILSDGTVVPCCLDGDGVINLGNIHEREFGEIIEAPRAKNLVRGFDRREVAEELCRKCGFRKRFGE